MVKDPGQASEPAFVRVLRSLIKILRDFFEFILEVADKYTEYECAIRSGSVAYHLLLSIFPLLLFLVGLASYVLSSDVIRQTLRAYLEATIPAVAPIVERVVEQTLVARGSFSILGAILLIWSASSVFTTLFVSMNVIWRASHRPFWRRRLMAIVTVLLIGGLFIASIWFSAFTVWPIANEITVLSVVWRWSLDPGLIIVFLWVVYVVLPNRRINPRAAFAGAFLAGIAWRAARSVFAWFLTSGFANYGLVYGSLASVIILMLWAYMSGMILFIGATFGSVLEQRLGRKAETV